MKEKAKYAGTYQVRVGDINYGGHMGNGRVPFVCHALYHPEG